MTIYLTEGQSYTIAPADDPGDDGYTYNATVTYGTASALDIVTPPLSGSGTNNFRGVITAVDDALVESSETFSVTVQVETYWTNDDGSIGSKVTTVEEAFVILDNDDPYQAALASCKTYTDLVKWGMQRYPLGDDDPVLRLEYARSEILKLRDIDSTNTCARNAEYYLIGAIAGMTRDPYLTLLTLGTPGYNLVKELANALGLQSSIQADPGKMNSLPGGTQEAWRGLLDGYSGKIGNTIQIYERNNINTAPQTLQAATLSVSSEEATFESQLDSSASVNVALYRDFEVPRDNVSRIIIDHSDRSWLKLSGGDDFIFGGNSKTYTKSGGGSDVIFGQGGADKLDGQSGADLIDGGDGADELKGGTGDDVLIGGDGRDVLFGGSGRDVLSGGAGKDLFCYENLTDSSAGELRDVILDFGFEGRDKIDLSCIDAVAIRAGNQRFHFIADVEFSKEGQIRATQVGADSLIQINTNDKRSGPEMEILIQSFDAAQLTADYFIL